MGLVQQHPCYKSDDNANLTKQLVFYFIYFSGLADRTTIYREYYWI